MTTPLRDFLKQKAEQYAAESEKAKEIIQEWQQAVHLLLNQLEEWLKAADPDGYIKPERTLTEVREPGLGRYQIETINLRAFGKWVGLVPKARKTGKRAAPQQHRAPDHSTGRVDVTDEIRRYVLYRFPSEKGDKWCIDDVAANADLQPLTPDRFEAALLSYFQ